MRKSPRFPPEPVQRPVRMLFDAKDQYRSQWVAFESIVGKIGCSATRLTRCNAMREGPTAAERQRVKELERELRELRQANELLKPTSAFFAQAELDHRLKA